MRFRPDKKYILWGVTAFLVAVCTILFIFAVFNYPVFAGIFSSFFKVILPVINGVLIAYLLNPVMKFIEGRLIPGFLKLINKKPPETARGKKIIRFVSLALSVIYVLVLITGFVMILVPQLISSITSITHQLPEYANNLSAFANRIFEDNPAVLEIVNQYNKSMEEWISDIINNSSPYVNKVISTLSSGIFKSISFVYNLVIGLILSIYILSIKEKFQAQFRKIISAFFSRKRAKSILEELRDIDGVFRDYIVSSIVDSIIIGLVCFPLCLIFSIPYPILISFIIGLTNIIPFFGPFIGGIPCAFIILMIDPVKALYFVIMIIVIQQVDGNVIKPRLFGNSTGLSAFWVVVAILVGGGLFGVAGMYLGTPVFAIIYNYFKRMVANRLVRKGLPPDTESYVNPGELPINTSTTEPELDQSDGVGQGMVGK